MEACEAGCCTNEPVPNRSDADCPPGGNEVYGYAATHRYLEADARTESGQIGALLRREGLYSSYLTDWRRAREAGQLTAFGSRKRGPTPAPTAQELDKLRHENERLRTRLQQTELIVTLLHLLGLTTSEIETDEST